MRPDECTNMPDNGFQVIPLRAFTDNYVWTLRNAACAAVVDPGEARPVLDYLAAEKLLLVAILATHHHQDHVGGIAEILETHAVPVYGPRGEPITTLTHPVGGGDRVAVEQLGVAFEVLDIPGHTRAHIAYYGSNMLFCGEADVRQSVLVPAIHQRVIGQRRELLERPVELLRRPLEYAPAPAGEQRIATEQHV